MCHGLTTKQVRELAYQYDARLKFKSYYTIFKVYVHEPFVSLSISSQAQAGPSTMNDPLPERSTTKDPQPDFFISNEGQPEKLTTKKIRPWVF